MTIPAEGEDTPAKPKVAKKKKSKQSTDGETKPKSVKKKKKKAAAGDGSSTTKGKKHKPASTASAGSATAASSTSDVVSEGTAKKSSAKPATEAPPSPERGIGRTHSESLPRPEPERGVNRTGSMGSGRPGRGRGPGRGMRPPNAAGRGRRPPNQRGMGRNASFDGRGRGRGRGPMGRPMGRNATSNRNLPPPPGARSNRNMLGGSSHHMPNDLDNSGKPISILRASSHRPRPVTSTRMNPDGSLTTSGHSLSFDSIDDARSGESSDEFGLDEVDEDEESPPMVSRVPDNDNAQPDRPGLNRRQKSMDRSMRGWTQSFVWRPSVQQTRSGGKRPGNEGDDEGDRRTQLSKFGSARSLLSIDKEFGPESNWIQFLRYLRILAPHPDEKPIKKKIRIFTWVTLFCDFLSSMVSLTTFDTVTKCCGEPILNATGIRMNWQIVIKVTVVLYLFLIFAEILPVLREGFPFNLANPFIGFLITFAMFFDDSIGEAVTMWVIEVCAVICECLVYKFKLQWHAQRQARLKKAEGELKALFKQKKKNKSQRMKAVNGGGEDSSSSFDEDSFSDENGGTASQVPVDVSQIRETRLLRERRLLRQAQSEDRVHLRYHAGGVSFNVFLVFVSMLLIVTIGRNGGLCINDFSSENVFQPKPLTRCPACQGVITPCEKCVNYSDPMLSPPMLNTSQCYYNYY